MRIQEMPNTCAALACRPTPLVTQSLDGKRGKCASVTLKVALFVPSLFLQMLVGVARSFLCSDACEPEPDLIDVRKEMRKVKEVWDKKEATETEKEAAWKRANDAIPELGTRIADAAVSVRREVSLGPSRMDDEDEVEGWNSDNEQEIRDKIAEQLEARNPKLVGSYIGHLDRSSADMFE